ncbi:hypothetical protein PHYSODRAFT_505230 [Phytophthora sojae]|uniref:FYVE-type domain-containing protein n=1 Tax=Phytophthora sojae (strain P6497) TaxID=1094619 RepID=G4ZQ24_PHYSP|nr:hypothetical protein PHYSODRAFT_505230 [Phytophthora sojae]EGZ14413.1 hypothetical protein PHYSODRAFT_505230 [Phytophthora sojae]|eukprot:XP_009528162.1 hypothetical protein PHYSODRAFT_505230 [Phytophthora sojae]
MARGDVLASPFKPVTLSSIDTKQLRAVAKTILDANLHRYRRFMDVDEGRVDPNEWKLVRTKDQVEVYLERPRRKAFSPFQVHPVAVQSALQPILCVGPTPGTLDDVMLGGVVDSTTAVSTSRTSFGNDFSDTAMLALVKDPSVLEPYTSVAVKWMELDVRRRSMGLVKNRDYVYVEMTGAKKLPNGEQVGYHVMHSVGIPQAHALPGKVRAKLSVCTFFRQVDKASVSIYSMGMMDPMSDRVRQVVVPRFVKMLLSTFKCREESTVKKLTQSLGKRYSELDNRRPSSSDNSNCITCTKRSWRLAKLSSRNNTCMICCGYICGSCRIEKKLKVPTPDMKIVTKKVAFCFSCLTDVMTANESEFSFVEDSNDAPEIPRSTYHSVWSTRLPRWNHDEPHADFASTR